MAGVFLLRMALGITFSLLIYHFLPGAAAVSADAGDYCFFAHFERCADLYGTLRL